MSSGIYAKEEVLAAQRRKISYLFTELRVDGTRSIVDRFVEPVETHRPIPDGLRSSPLPADPRPGGHRRGLARGPS